jgi:Tol biopolymer transport system component
MKRRLSMFVAAALLVAPLQLGAQSGNDLFQKALAKERAEGQLDAAIQLYEQVVREFAADRPLAARALLQIGRCYERLGKDGAQKAYDRLVRDYGDQRPAADEARDRLAVIGRASTQTTPSMRLVWTGPGVDTQGSPSPDGRYLSYVDFGENPNGDLAIRDVASGQSRRLTQGDSPTPGVEFAQGSVFSPDGRRIAYGWFKGDLVELRVTGTDRPRPRVLYRNAEAGYLEPAAWTPDGKFIVTVFETPAGAVQIGLVSAADGTRRVLKTLEWKWPGGLTVSPDGRFIAYAVSPEGSLNRDIYVLAVNGSREWPLVEHPSDDTAPLWTPDGSGVVFASDRSGSLDAWLVPVGESGPRGPAQIVKRNLGRGSPIGLTRDGALYYAVTANSTDIYLGTFDAGSGRASPGPSISERVVGASYGPDWSPDGTRVSYFSKRGVGGPGSSTIVVRSVADGTEHELVPRLQYFHRPRWAADGKALVAQGRGLRGPHGLYAIDARTGEIELLVKNELATFQAWSPDGRTLYYSSREGIFGLDVASRAHREIYRGDTGEKMVSPDGRLLAVQTLEAADGSATAIRLVPLTGGPARTLLSLRSPEKVTFFGGLTWTPDGRHVLFVKQSGQNRELWRVDATSGLSEPTGLSLPGLSYVRLHPDGRRLAYTAGKRQEEVWLIEHFLPARPPSPGLRRTGTGVATATRR